MRTSCHVSSTWTGDGTKASPWRPQFTVDHPTAEGFEYDMLSAGDPRSVPQVPVDLLVRCLNDAAWQALQADANYTPSEVVEYSTAPWPEEELLW